MAGGGQGKKGGGKFEESTCEWLGFLSCARACIMRVCARDMMAVALCRAIIHSLLNTLVLVNL